MPTYNSLNDLLSLVAKSADLCMKPWKYSVLLKEDNEMLNQKEFTELLLKIECRDEKGNRYIDNDLELEIYRSGKDLNITLSWSELPLRPILWQGKHSLWMDAHTGERSISPVEGEKLEALARRLRSAFASQIINF
ncbi:hypothetical protein [Prochlorococcus sp. MIT 1223]|uniref:hypothetical protein n=1 Tax=Prochlorococcus sp. MIT 1223 TaxID=3096217 RepID=UPI002A75AFD7|nr:hypothetical protein [Prochlorococcus sp. MIT 1223]